MYSKQNTNKNSHFGCKEGTSDRKLFLDKLTWIAYDLHIQVGHFEGKKQDGGAREGGPRSEILKSLDSDYC